MCSRVFESIGIGEGNATSAEELRVRYSLSKRQLRAVMHSLRERGAAVCASKDAHRGGYYRPANRGELQAYIRRCEKEIKTELAALKPMKQYLREGREP